jgi:hypothetical protein
MYARINKHSFGLATAPHYYSLHLGVYYQSGTIHSKLSFPEQRVDYLLIIAYLIEKVLDSKLYRATMIITLDTGDPFGSFFFERLFVSTLDTNS